MYKDVGYVIACGVSDYTAVNFHEFLPAGAGGGDLQRGPRIEKCSANYAASSDFSMPRSRRMQCNLHYILRFSARAVHRQPLPRRGEFRGNS